MVDGLSYNEMRKKIKAKHIPAVSLLYGTEAYFIQNLQALFLKHGIDDAANAVTYDLEETPIQEVIIDAETYPFLGENKLIFIHNPIFLKAKQDKLPFEHDVTMLERYLESPVDYSTIVFIAPYEKLDERKKLTKLFRKTAAVAECNPVKSEEVDRWIHGMAEQLHITVESAAIEVLLREQTSNLQMLENELTKMALYVGENGAVTKEVAEELVSHTTNSSSLRLVDAVMERKLHQAVAIYKDLEKLKEEPIALIGLLAYQFRMILRVKLLKAKGYSQGQIQKNLSVHPYVVKVALSRESQFTIPRLHKIIDNLANADAVMKQGKMEKGLAFELLLHEMVTAS